MKKRTKKAILLLASLVIGFIVYSVSYAAHNPNLCIYLEDRFDDLKYFVFSFENPPSSVCPDGQSRAVMSGECVIIHDVQGPGGYCWEERDPKTGKVVGGGCN